MYEKKQKRQRRIRGALFLGSLGFLVALLPKLSVPAGTPPSAAAPQKKPTHVVLAWNNLGMHCYNPDFRDLAVLPPYNTLWAQVIQIGDPPRFVTSGISVQYRFPSNTYSAGKTNFWSYARQLFGLAEDLPPNIGLKGYGLSGDMELVQDAALGTHYEAVGIPLTEYQDHDQKLRKPDPYQLAEITVRDETGTVLAQTMAVAPVSSELNCINCHADDGDATTSYPITPTGKVETNILALHDHLNITRDHNPLAEPALMSSRPVLCANCHSSNALEARGKEGVSSLSFAMHNHHKDLPDVTPSTTEGCYNCHPGPNTQCLRDTMSQSFGFNCTSCHGNMADLASPTLPREPWLSEPRCDNAACHGPGYALDQPLYRNSRGHGGTYCAGCHDSPHAIAPSREHNDSIKFLLLQGQPNALRKCTVCHATQPSQAFKHAWAAAP